MSKMNIFDNSWIDLVFEGRNQSYGAYQLRKQDSKTTMIALFSGIALMGFAVCIPVGINYFNPTAQVDVIDSDGKIIQVDNLPEEEIFTQSEAPKVEPPKPLPAQPAAPAPPAVSTIKFTNSIVATSEPVPDPPHTTDFENKNPGSQTTEGQHGGNITSVDPGVKGGTGINPESTEPEGATNASMVDVMPLYPGGMEAFYREVGRKYRVPESEDSMVAKVYVSFVIEKDGSMTNIQILRDPNQSLGLGKEALRVLKSMKASWKPGIKDGKPVRTAYNLPITVKIN